MNAENIKYADDETLSVKRIIQMRIPSLALGLILGIFLSFVTSRFEEALSQDIRIAFFIPFIVYMADAVGTQTQNIYIRDLRTGKASFKIYLMKETLAGVIFGVASSSITALITAVWLASTKITLAVSLAMFGAIAAAPLVALLVAEILQLGHKDPAVGAGPLATVIQDTLSVLIYGIIASSIIL